MSPPRTTAAIGQGSCPPEGPSLAVFISLETQSAVGGQRVQSCRQREDPRPRPGPAWQVAEAAGRAGGACGCNQWPRGCYAGRCTWRAGPAG